MSAHKLPGSSGNSAGFVTDHAVRKRPFYTIHAFYITLIIPVMLCMKLVYHFMPVPGLM